MGQNTGRANKLMSSNKTNSTAAGPPSGQERHYKAVVSKPASGWESHYKLEPIQVLLPLKQTGEMENFSIKFFL